MWNGSKTKIMKRIGVLALQGSFLEHIRMLKKLNVDAIEIRSLKDTKNLDAIILPGGESTTLMKLLKSTKLDEWLKKMAKKGLPIYGTCAGLIVLSKNYLNLIDIEVKRNAYGPQLDSFEDEIEWMPNPKSKIQNPKLKGIFIRSPQIKKSLSLVGVQLKSNHMICSAFYE